MIYNQDGCHPLILIITKYNIYDIYGIIVVKIIYFTVRHNI